MRNPKNIRILVACEESQAITKEFLALGFDSWSCDLKPCSGGIPERHYQRDCFEVINSMHWDLVIAHPPCTFLSVCGNAWLHDPKRIKNQGDAVEFFMKFVNLSCVRHMAIENPIGCMSTIYRKPDQIIQPWEFGDSYSKSTCLWLRNLPLLSPTKIVDRGEFVTFDSGVRMPKWYADLWRLPKERRQTMRSKTFPGIAKAIAKQWGAYLLLEKEEPTVYIQQRLFE